MAGTSRSGGRNRVPDEIKARRGTADQKTLAVVKTMNANTAVVGSVPQPARALVAGGAGAALWERIWSFGAAWLRPDTDHEVVLMVCELADEEQQLRQKVMTDGDWRDRVQLRALEKNKFSLMCSLGLTPVDRSRLGAVAVKVETQMEAFRNSVAKKRSAQT